jgi:hypothetical protein
MKSEGKTAVRRRDFLRILGSGVGVTAAASALAPSARADSETDADKRKPRYRETEHVKAYYRVNKYPTKG